MKCKYYVVLLVTINGHNATASAFINTNSPLNTQESLERETENLKKDNGFDNVLILNIIELKG